MANMSPFRSLLSLDSFATAESLLRDASETIQQSWIDLFPHADGDASAITREVTINKDAFFADIAALANEADSISEKVSTYTASDTYDASVIRNFYFRVMESFGVSDWEHLEDFQHGRDLSPDSKAYVVALHERLTKALGILRDLDKVISPPPPVRTPAPAPAPADNDEDDDTDD